MGDKRKVIDRLTGEVSFDDEPSDGLLARLYSNALGRALMASSTLQHAVSSVWGACMRSPLSARRIEGFVSENGVEMGGCPPVSSYGSFAEFFSRPRDVTVSASDADIVSVADSRLLALPIGDASEFRVVAKGTEYSIPLLMGIGDMLRPTDDDGKATVGTIMQMAEWLSGGTCLVFRLSLTDWHRFLFPFSGTVVASWDVPGQLHSVRRIADGDRPYSTNRRHVSVLSSDRMPMPVLMVEVGALLVGHIVQNDIGDGPFSVGEEKGRFELGGSSIVLALPKSVNVSTDILRNSREGIETRVRAGEAIGSL